MAERRPLRYETLSPIVGSWVEVALYPEAGGGISCYFRDITDRRAAEAEREELLAAAERARAEAESANRTKSEFLAVMSHELRTPLNAIGGYTELIALGIHGPVTEQQQRDLDRIVISQRHLLGLINEVLNYARLETGTVRFDIAPVSVREVLARAEELVAPQVRGRGLTLSMDGCAQELMARADPEKMRQIIVNLLSNAVKFTDPGGRITLSCGEVDGGRVCVAVRDTGIGIPPEKQGAIFEPFVQVRSDLARTAEGTGLGLAISRDLARGMEGELEVESAPGAGSTFILTLPRADGA
jgi:signal transduction histidine kinase